MSYSYTAEDAVAELRSPSLHLVVNTLIHTIRNVLLVRDRPSHDCAFLDRLRTIVTSGRISADDEELVKRFADFLAKLYESELDQNLFIKLVWSQLELMDVVLKREDERRVADEVVDNLEFQLATAEQEKKLLKSALSELRSDHSNEEAAWKRENEALKREIENLRKSNSELAATNDSLHTAIGHSRKESLDLDDSWELFVNEELTEPLLNTEIRDSSEFWEEAAPFACSTFTVGATQYTRWSPNC